MPTEGHQNDTMQPQKAFDTFCRQNGIQDPTERDMVFFLAGLRSTLDQEPVAWGHFTPSGELLQLTQFVDPRRDPVPLYKRPVAAVEKPEMPEDTIRYVWRTYYAADGDVVGFARWLERITKFDK